MFNYRAKILRKASAQDVKLLENSLGAIVPLKKAGVGVSRDYMQYVVELPTVGSNSEILAHAIALPGIIASYREGEMVIVSQLHSGPFVILGELGKESASLSTATCLTTLSVLQLLAQGGDLSRDMRVIPASDPAVHAVAPITLGEIADKLTFAIEEIEKLKRENSFLRGSLT